MLHDKHYNRLFISRPISSFNHRTMIRAYSLRHSIPPSLSKDSLRALSHILTGWSYLHSFQHKIGNVPTDLCPRCSEDEDTSEHFLTSCPSIAYDRLQAFGHLFITSDWFHQHNFIPSVIKFLRLTKYLDYFEPP